MPAHPPYRVSHVIFDVDGTLVDWEHSYAAALTAAAEELSSRLGRAVAPAALAQARELVVVEPEWRGRLLREVREESFRRVLVASGEPSPDALAAVAAAYFRARDDSLAPFDDVEPTLEELARRGFTLVAATNGNASLHRLPLARHLAHIHLAEAGGVSKPEPRFFLDVLERTGSAPHMAISVGDNVENDVIAPRSLGMHALYLDRARTAQHVDVPRIERLDELPALLEQVDG